MGQKHVSSPLVAGNALLMYLSCVKCQSKFIVWWNYFAIKVRCPRQVPISVSGASFCTKKKQTRLQPVAAKDALGLVRTHPDRDQIDNFSVRHYDMTHGFWEHGEAVVPPSSKKETVITSKMISWSVIYGIGSYETPFLISCFSRAIKHQPKEFVNIKVKLRR